MGNRNKTEEKATLRDYTLYVPEGHIDVESPAWYAWLENNDTFYISAVGGHKVCISVRCEVRSGTRHFYAYKRVLGKLHKRYVGSRVTWKDIKSLLERMVGTDYYLWWKQSK